MARFAAACVVPPAYRWWVPQDRHAQGQKPLLIKVMLLAQNSPRAWPGQLWQFGAWAMQRANRIVLHALAMVALVQALGACSSDLSLNNLTLAPKPETLMRKPDWATFTAGKNDLALRPITAADLVNQDGQCPTTSEQAGSSADSTGEVNQSSLTVAVIAQPVGVPVGVSGRDSVTEMDSWGGFGPGGGGPV